MVIFLLICTELRLDYCLNDQEHYTRFDDTADLEHLASIQDHIKRETDGMKHSSPILEFQSIV
jgi:hypothetical protein